MAVSVDLMVALVSAIYTVKVSITSSQVAWSVLFLSSALS